MNVIRHLQLGQSRQCAQQDFLRLGVQRCDVADRIGPSSAESPGYPADCGSCGSVIAAHHLLRLTSIGRNLRRLGSVHPLIVLLAWRVLLHNGS